MFFRNATESDTSSLAAISIEVWIGTYLRNGVNGFFADYALAEFTAAKFEAIIAANAEHIIVSENENGIDGFIRLSLDSPAPLPGCSSTEIKTLYVQPRHHGKGVGKGLLNEGLRQCANLGVDAVWLTVNSENTAALTFYSALDFHNIGQTQFRIADQAYLNEVLRHQIV
ncbi:GNAT family N-acetyltransferase [Agrobacterium rosae]|uniref:GNAT family N-acetyltransferase n=1 Tax=Agrobacterium rosae TaxID=1972867 RepID=A0AAW9F7H1_9HYPH|nr:GNAT family N-acetyltransferase [Agrobacterium rosae]MDX8301760.1 GNAT family N-acetyltransferase [Agrobacterium rosae]